MPKAAVLPSERNPCFIVAMGRGRTGKTVFLSWLAETAARDIPLRIIDADLNNPVLSQRFPDVASPSGVDDERRLWLEKQFEAQAEAALGPNRHDILLDLGGGDLLIKRWGAELRLVEALVGSSVDPVAIHMLGADTADLAYLEDVEQRRLFCPEKTVLVMNRGLVSPSRPADEAFREVINSDIVKHVLSRGGRLVVMPYLACMEAVLKSRLSFHQAQELTSPIGLFNRIRVRYWLNTDMPAMRAELNEWI